MSDESILTKTYEYIRDAGYKYASWLYSDGFDWILVDGTPPTKEDVYDNFNESAHHEGIMFSLFDDNKNEHSKFLESLDYDKIADHFCEGGHRLIDESFYDA
jgi:hypothetical protein